MRTIAWPLPPAGTDEDYHPEAFRDHSPLAFDLPDEAEWSESWFPEPFDSASPEPPTRPSAPAPVAEMPKPLPLSAKHFDNKKSLTLAVEEKSQLATLVDLLLPQIRERLLFASGDPFLQDEARTNAFHRVTKTEVLDELRLLLPERKRFSVRSKDLKEIFDILRAELNAGSFDAVFNNEPGLINARNGVVCIDTGTPYLLDSDPKARFTYFINADFDRATLSEDAPAWEAFLDTSLEGNSEKRCQLVEFIGYCLSDSIEAKTVMFLTGASNSGKSVILRFLNRLLPENEVTHFPLHEVGNPFNGQQLCQAKLNISAETDAQPLVVDAMLKALTGGGDRIAASRKFCDAKTMRPHAKLICAANTLPELASGDTSNAFFNRLEVLPFTREIPKEEQDPLLEEALWRERDVIFTEAMFAVAQLMARNFRFTRSADAVRELERYRTTANSFLAFESECLIYDPEWSIGCAQLYEIYKRYCHAANLNVLTKNRFRQYLLRRCGITERTYWIDKHQVRCYDGVAMKTKEEN